LDGDGISDIAVGASGDGITPGQARDDAYRGAVHVLLLNADGTAKSSRKIGSGIGGGPIIGEYDRFGSAIASVGDLDGDGLPDLAVGAYAHEVDGIESGGVHLLFVNGDGTAKRSQFIPHDLGGDPVVDEYFGFGYALTSAGDLDGDGVVELAVGVPGYDFENGVGSAVYILHFDPTALYGDYNQDGVVNTADYSVWRDQLGTDVEPGSGADGNRDGAVDEDDYKIWKANFGRSWMGSNASVPANTSARKAAGNSRIDDVDLPSPVAFDSRAAHRAVRRAMPNNELAETPSVSNLHSHGEVVQSGRPAFDPSVRDAALIAWIASHRSARLVMDGEDGARIDAESMEGDQHDVGEWMVDAAFDSLVGLKA
jgi:FG-GAP repeat/Dockerin type I domain